MSINTDCLSATNIKVLRSGGTYTENGNIEFAPDFGTTRYKTTLMPQPSVGLILETKSGSYRTEQQTCGLLLQGDAGMTIGRNGSTPTSLQNADVVFGLYKGAHDEQSSVTKLDWMGGYNTSCNSVIIDGDTQFYNLRTTSGDYIIRNGVLQITGGGGGLGNVDVGTLRIQGGVIAIGPRINIADNINIGECTTTYGTGIAIGGYNWASCGSISIGYLSTADCSTIAVGQYMPRTGADRQTLFRPGTSSFIIGFSHGDSPALVVYNGRVNDHSYSQLRYTISLDKLATLANGGSAGNSPTSGSTTDGELVIHRDYKISVNACGSIDIGKPTRANGDWRINIGTYNDSVPGSISVGLCNSTTEKSISIGSNVYTNCGSIGIGNSLKPMAWETLFNPRGDGLAIGFFHEDTSPSIIVKNKKSDETLYTIPLKNLAALAEKTNELLALLSK